MVLIRSRSLFLRPDGRRLFERRGQAAGSGRKHSIRIHLGEDVFRGGKAAAGRVDREKGVVRDVKVLGWESLNRRRYTREAGARALPLYEGVQVFTDHQPVGERNKSRTIRDLVGILQGIEVREDGLYARELVLTSLTKPSCVEIMDMAERTPEAFGLSHDADGTGHRDADGWEVIETITEVRSVDVVTDPATVNSIFESRNAGGGSRGRWNNRGKRMKIRSYFEAILPRLKGKLRPGVRALLEEESMKKLCEDDMDLGPDQPIPEPDQVDPMDALSSGFEAAIIAVVKDESMDAAAKAKKISELLKVHEKLIASPAAADAGEGEGDPPADDADGKKKEGRNRSGGQGGNDSAVKQLREELAVRDLIEDAGLTFAKPDARRAFAKSLISLAESERKALIEERKASVSGGARRGGGATSTEAGSYRIPEGAGNGQGGKKLVFKDSAARLAYLRGAGGAG